MDSTNAESSPLHLRAPSPLFVPFLVRKVCHTDLKAKFRFFSNFTDLEEWQKQEKHLFSPEGFHQHILFISYRLVVFLCIFIRLQQQFGPSRFFSWSLDYFVGSKQWCGRGSLALSRCSSSSFGGVFTFLGHRGFEQPRGH